MTDDGLHWRGAPISSRTAWPCLDVINTVEWRLSDRKEFLADYAELTRWGRYDGLLTTAELRGLLAAAATRESEAAAAHQRAIRLRETLYALFSAVAHHCEPPAGALAALNRELAATTVPLRVVAAAEGFAREWLDPRSDLDWFLHPVIRSAADFLTSAELVRLKECPGGPGKACGFLFLDDTKNRSRRWCSGRTCGNRARLHRHYARLHVTRNDDGVGVGRN